MVKALSNQFKHKCSCSSTNKYPYFDNISTICLNNFKCKTKIEKLPIPYLNDRFKFNQNYYYYFFN